MDGSDGACVSGAEIELNGLGPTQGAYDSATCQYAISSGKGTIHFVVSKAEYDTIRLDPLVIRFHDDDCCGDYDDKSIEIKWYKSIKGMNPEVTYR